MGIEQRQEGPKEEDNQPREVARQLEWREHELAENPTVGEK